jgi:hypothetical protein
MQEASRSSLAASSTAPPSYSNGPLLLNRKLIEQAVSKLRANGATIVDDVEAIPFDASAFFDMDGLIMKTDLKVSLDGYLASLPESAVRSLADVIQ